MLDPEIKAKWIEALRSGKYKQGRRMLHSDKDEYCCLGVLCEVAGLSKQLTRDSFNGPCYEYLFEDGFTQTGVLSGELREAMEGKMMDLATKNDTGESFSEIADYIQENL